MMRVLALLCVATAISAVACKAERAERVAASYSSVTKPTTKPPPPPRSRPPDKIVVGLASIPVEESYEERAASTITEANLQAKVSELEKELSL
jgi:hypothetical protein